MHLGFFFFWSFDLWRIFPDQLLISDASNKTITWWPYIDNIPNYFANICSLSSATTIQPKFKYFYQIKLIILAKVVLWYSIPGTESGKKINQELLLLKNFLLVNVGSTYVSKLREQLWQSSSSNLLISHCSLPCPVCPVCPNQSLVVCSGVPPIIPSQAVFLRFGRLLGNAKLVFWSFDPHCSLIWSKSVCARPNQTRPIRHHFIQYHIPYNLILARVKDGMSPSVRKFFYQNWHCVFHQCGNGFVIQTKPILVVYNTDKVDISRTQAHATVLKGSQRQWAHKRRV